jgi:hypothetical protein
MSYRLIGRSVDQPQNTGLGHQSWSASNGYAATQVCWSKDDIHAGPSFGDSAPVHTLHALPMCRKMTAVMLTNQEQINQVQTCRERTNAVRGPYCESDTSNKANDSTNCMVCKMKFYDTNKAQVDWIQCNACKLWLHKTNTNITDDDCNQQQSYDESFINSQLLRTVQYSWLFCLFSSL